MKNPAATLRVVWNSAKAWKYVNHDPFEGLALADWDKQDPPFFSIEDVKRIIATAKPPYDVLFRLVWEAGIRRGEVCALNVENVDLDNLIIAVRRSRWNRYMTSTKSKRPRVFSISSGLARRLGAYVNGRSPDVPLFVSKQGKRLHPDNFVKRHLKPILNKLGLRGGLHAFRHGNATAIDAVSAPMKVRQERLGHVASATALGRSG